jgi:NAD(P)-dependent dehydrogenase (short-subunit alcohol dehydrogenase family)
MTKWSMDHFREKMLDRILFRRFGGEDDLKGAVVFLASRASDFVTGHILCVDGGEMAWESITETFSGNWRWIKKKL